MPKPMSRDGRHDILSGAMPRWFTVLLLGMLVWLGKRYADSVDTTLREHGQRITAVELWKARSEVNRN